MKRAPSNRISVSPALAFLSWFFLLALPCLLISISVHSFLDSSLRQKAELVRPHLTNELNHLIQELSPEAWLRHRLKEFDQKNGFVSQSDLLPGKAAKKFQELSAEKIRQQMKDFLQIEVACVFYHGPDTNTVSYSVTKNDHFEFRSLPSILLKRMFGMINRQFERDSIFSAKVRKNILRLIHKDGMKRCLSGVEFLLKTAFGNISTFPVGFHKIRKTISTRLGDTGPVFYYYSPATLEAASKKFNLGGYLLAIRAQDITLEKIVTSALKKTFNHGFSRKIVLSDAKIGFPETYKSGPIGGFVSNESGEHLRAILPQRLLLAILQKGTIKMGNAENIREKVPLLQVSAPIKLLQHPMANYRQGVKFFLLLLFISGSAIFLRLAMYGMNFQLSVSLKIFIAIGLSAFLPASLMLLSFVTNAEFEGNSSRQMIRQYISHRQSIIQKQVSARISDYERGIVQLGARFESAVSNAELVKGIKKWLRTSVAESAHLQSTSGPSTRIENPVLNMKHIMTPIDKELQMVMSQSFMHFVSQSPLLNAQLENLVLSFAKNFKNAATLHDFFIKSGNLVSLPRVSRNFKFVALPIFEKHLSLGHIPTSLLMLNFPTIRLMERIFSELRQEISLSEIWGDYKIDLSICFRKESDLEFPSLLMAKSLNKKSVLPFVSLCNLLKREVVWETGYDYGAGLAMARYDETLPYITYIRATRIKGATRGFFSSRNIAPAAYLMALMLCVLVLSKLLFIDPIKEFSHGLEEIARGNLNHRFKLETGDEFEELSNSFNRMTQGLIEKEKLAMFVSEDVIKAVEDDASLIMKPGGELVQATILFCEPAGFDEFTAENSPVEVVRCLNYLVSQGSSICSSHGGTIDKIIDNTLMVVFRNTPNEVPDFLRAAKAAIDMAALMNSKNQNFPFNLKSGISSGKVISGKIGSKTGKLDFTVIGDTVNMAARMKTCAHLAQSSGIIISPATAQLLGKYAQLKATTEIEVKGKAGKHILYELLSIL